MIRRVTLAARFRKHCAFHEAMVVAVVDRAVRHVAIVEIGEEERDICGWILEITF